MKVYIVIISIIATTVMSGCNKWLEVNPKTETKEQILLNDEQGFKDAIIGVYQHLGSTSLYGQNLTMGFLDVLAQRYSVNASTHAYYQEGRFNYTDLRVEERINNIWSGMYKGIANVNNIINQVDDKRATFRENNFARVKGEALALRALMHFDLLRMFGVSPAVDAEAPSIPFMEAFEVESSPLLKVSEVITRCLKDLQDAEQLLSVDKSIKGEYNVDPFISYTRNHMNFWSVKGLQARIHLYAGNKVEAIKAAKVVIDDHEVYFPFVKITEATQSINKERTYTTEQLFSLYVFKLKEITEGVTKTSVVGGVPTFAHLTTTINTLYEYAGDGSTDIRRNQLFAPYVSSLSSSKYWQDDFFYDFIKCNVPIIRLSEMFYIAAESASTAEEGVGYLNKVRAARGLRSLSETISPANLQTEILKEYKKETYAEGQLFYYFKRLNANRVDGSSLVPNYVFPLPISEIEFGNRD